VRSGGKVATKRKELSEIALVSGREGKKNKELCGWKK